MRFNVSYAESGRKVEPEVVTAEPLAVDPSQRPIERLARIEGLRARDRGPGRRPGDRPHLHQGDEGACRRGKAGGNPQDPFASSERRDHGDRARRPRRQPLRRNVHGRDRLDRPARHSRAQGNEPRPRRGRGDSLHHGARLHERRPDARRRRRGRRRGFLASPPGRGRRSPPDEDL